MDDTTPLYALIHIPKAAGKTLRWIARRQYGVDEEVKLPKSGWRDALGSVRGAVRLVTDVPIVGLHEQVEAPVQYVTMLRHPVQRAISFYRYHNPDGDFSNFKLTRFMVNNAMTRAIAGVESPREPVTATTLRTALANLRDHFAWVGISERFDESLVVAKHRLGWRNILYQPRNVSAGASRRIEPPAEAVRAIELANPFDLVLYDAVAGKLDRVIANGGPSFALEVEAYRRLLATQPFDGVTHLRPTKPQHRDYGRHRRELVRQYHLEGHKNWREFRAYVHEFHQDLRDWEP